MMKKYLWIFICFVLIIVIVIFSFNKSNDKQEDTYTAKRTGTNINNENATNTKENNNIEHTEVEKNKSEDKEQEKKISYFSTRLPKDTRARYSNIELACKNLDGTIVESGKIFSLWDVLGCPTKEKGYRKAKTFTSTGKVTKSYGGGICQVSTTIYNAVLEADDLKIIERHEHSRNVSYIKDGKDAAVSYKSADFKFKNTLDYDVKIEAKVADNKVKIKLIRIS